VGETLLGDEPAVRPAEVGTIAVKVIDQFGNEVLKVYTAK
jgi:hypothetical protein